MANPTLGEQRALSVVVYTADSKLREPSRLLREMGSDLLSSRELAWRLFLRDISAQYRQSLLGYIWLFIPPLVSTGTFVLLRKGGVFEIDDVGMPYAVFVLAGTVLWQIFADAITNPLRSVNANRSMLTKINFPREALVVAGVLMTLFNASIRILVLALAFFYLGINATASSALFPLGLFGILLFGTCIGLLLAPLGILYQDVQLGLNMILGFWLFLTPVMFPTAKTGVAGALMKWNPVTPLVVVSRQWLVGQTATHVDGFAVVTAVSLGVTAIGWIGYRVSWPHIVARLGM